ncbi:unnamed protein product [Orchesella dallaii]|uniref:RRM domain-containing protein n=1 Tax=Orchesella dallaii TaxID=48710 RepID=A0ABP1S3W3_9HEXA
MSESGRLLQCLLCQSMCDTRKDWLCHLLECHHQTKARKVIHQWGQPDKECTVVVFASSSIASSLELLQFLSRGSMNLVTNFVWFEKQPNVGFIQFESKQKVEEIVSGFERRQINIGSHLVVQIKKAEDCMSLEWLALIPTAKIVSDLLFVEVLDSENESGDSPPDMDTDASYLNNSQPIDESPSGLRPVPEQLTSSPVCVSPRPNESLETLYGAIHRTMEIPDDAYEECMYFLKTVQNILAQEFPGCQLILFRNWYLKLRNTTPINELLFYLDHQGIYKEGSNGCTGVQIRLSKCPPMSRQVKHILTSSPEGKRIGITVSSKSGQFPGLTAEEGRQNFYCHSNGIPFGVVSKPTKLPEIQMNRLLSYFYSFDPRVKPLLVVIRYWAKMNGLRLAPANPGFDKSCSSPDPAAFDWLVIFFLCHKMKILPTPREVRNRRHPKMMFEKVDIGFTPDPLFAQRFFERYQQPSNEVHAFNVLSLAERFFSFYSNELLLDENNEVKVVLNTRDGEMIPMHEFKGTISHMQTKLSLPERKLARKGRVAIEPVPHMILLHPIDLRHGFSLCNENVTSVGLAMQTTGRKLEEALNLYKNGKCSDFTAVFAVQ